MVFKEFVQMRRDRLTFGMMVGIPLLQIILFGYAINVDPKHLRQPCSWPTTARRAALCCMRFKTALILISYVS